MGSQSQEDTSIVQTVRVTASDKKAEKEGESCSGATGPTKEDQ